MNRRRELCITMGSIASELITQGFRVRRRVGAGNGLRHPGAAFWKRQAALGGGSRPLGNTPFRRAAIRLEARPRLYPGHFQSRIAGISSPYSSI
jgi:hypothetical protein